MYTLSFNILILVRIISSLIFGFGIGLERELTNKNAGLRTHILVCVGSCVFTILSIYAFPTAVNGSHGDPARIAAQVLTGIGFIGGGTVLRHGSSVYGLTTAATLWVAASIGMACGTGMILTGLITTLVAVSVLVLIRVFERDVLVHNVKNIRRLKISAKAKEENSDNIYDYIVDSFDHVHEISKARDDQKNHLINIVAIVEVSGKKQIQGLYKKFDNIKGVDSISIQENNE